MNVQTYAGAIFALASASLAQIARTQLGTSFSLTPKAKGLVTHGLYSRLQHPMYLFVDLTICGVALAVHQWYVLLLLVILLPLQIRNSYLEGRLLQEKFGDRFEAYRRSRWF